MCGKTLLNLLWSICICKYHFLKIIILWLIFCIYQCIPERRIDAGAFLMTLLAGARGVGASIASPLHALMTCLPSCTKPLSDK